MLAPILEKIVGWQRPRIREFFESYGLLIQEWERARTDWLTLRPVIPEAASAASADKPKRSHYSQRRWSGTAVGLSVAIHSGT